MKPLVLCLLSLLSAPQIAPVPQSVAITEEPHHKLVLENPYVRVFRVSVPDRDATLLYRDARPYVTVSLGDNDFMNVVAGKPQTEIVQKDLQIGYFEGGLERTIKPQHGSAFDRITVELLRPQGTAKNRCEKIVDGPLGDCKSGPDSPLMGLLKLFNVKPAFMTNDIFVDTISLAKGVNYSATAAGAPQLLIACDHSEFKVSLPGQSASVLHGGEVLWVPTGNSAKITSTVPQGTAAVVIISFKAADKSVN